MTAKDFAAYSAQAGKMRDAIKPEETSPVANINKLAMYHLGMASRELQRLAEWQAEREKNPQEPKK